MTLAPLLDRFRSDTPTMVDAIAALVECESPSGDARGLRNCADLVAQLGERQVGVSPDRLGPADAPVLRWHFGGQPRVLLVGHLDTVWPLGTLDRWPLTVDGDRMSGPGVFDMKSGLVQLFHALGALDDLEGVVVLVNSDEETGSKQSRELIEADARKVGPAGSALVLEPSAGGALKIARKGVSMYTLHVEGRAAHAGLEPEKGANATVELAHQVLAIAALARPDAGTTVTPTVMSAGTTTNTVPAAARLSIDVRALTEDEQRRVDEELHALTPRVERTALTLDGAINRPPLARASSAALFERAKELATASGMTPPGGVEVGGGSDGNFTAGVGVPTLDGLGAVGDNAHAEGEFALISAIAERTALVAALVDELRAS